MNSMYFTVHPTRNPVGAAFRQDEPTPLRYEHLFSVGISTSMTLLDLLFANDNGVHS